MEKRLDLERRGKAPHQVVDLNLDNSRATQIEGLNSEYTSLETLSLIGCGLTSLKGFPKLPKLRKLELSENRVSSGLETLTDSSDQLTHLNLSNNKIKDLDTLKPLTSFKSLTHLDLFNNEVCKSDDYRTSVFKLISSLKVLDGYDQEGNEAEESDADEVVGQNGDHEDDDDEDEEDSDDDGEEEEEEEEEENGPGLEAIYNLSAIYNDKLGDEDEDGDYSGEEEEEEEDLEDEEDEDQDNNQESDEPKGKKRKVETEEEEKGGTGGGKDVPK